MDSHAGAPLQELAQLLHDYGQRWQIQREGPIWAAIERPEPKVLILHCAYTIPELRKKLEKEENR